MEINLTNSEKNQMKQPPSSTNQTVSVIIYSSMNENKQITNQTDSELNNENEESGLKSLQLSTVNDNNLKNTSMRMQQLKKNKVKKILNNYDHSKYLNNNKSLSEESSPSSTFVSCQLNSSSSSDLSSSQTSSESFTNNKTDNKMSINETTSDSAPIIVSSSRENIENINYIQLDFGLNDEIQNESSDYAIITNAESSSFSHSSTNNSNNTNSITTGALMLNQNNSYKKNNNNNIMHYQNFNNLDSNMKEYSINNNDKSALKINDNK